MNIIEEGKNNEVGNLWLGSMGAIRSKEYLVKFKITCIISVIDMAIKLPKELKIKHFVL